MLTRLRARARARGRIDVRACALPYATRKLVLWLVAHKSEESEHGRVRITPVHASEFSHLKRCQQEEPFTEQIPGSEP